MNEISSTPPERGGAGVKAGRKEKMVSDFRAVFGMFLYLWVLFALFSYHKAIVLAEHGISYKPFGMAMINAFILAKVMFFGDKLKVAAGLRRKSLLFPILNKSLVLAVLFILFNMIEAVLKGLWHGKSLADSMPRIGSGSPLELIVTGIIIAIALIPFFAFRELSLHLGKGVVGGLLLKGSDLHDGD